MQKKVKSVHVYEHFGENGCPLSKNVIKCQCSKKSILSGRITLEEVQENNMTSNVSCYQQNIIAATKRIRNEKFLKRILISLCEYLKENPD